MIPAASHRSNPYVLAQLELARRELQRRRQATIVATSFDDWLPQVTPEYTWDWRHLAYIREHLAKVTSGELRKLMIFCPPRHGKSECTTIRYPVYRMERDPATRVIVGCYNTDLANKFSRDSRRIARARRLCGPGLKNTEAEWEIGGGGGLRTAAVGAAPTGRGADLIVIDDPVRSREDAESENYREKTWDWYTNDMYTRLEPGGAIILILCMTGDTPVLMADGTETPLRDIKVGDRVATYDNGRLGVSTVLNHKSNHLDMVYAIRMISGRVVRANARHPFLVEEGGKLKWVRLRNLTTAHKIVTVRGNGVSGRGRSALLKAVKLLPFAEGTACRTTAKRCGLTDTDRRQSTQSTVEMLASKPGTGSPVPSTMQCMRRKVEGALFAGSHQATMFALTGAESCALTIATRRTPSEGCCATIATSPWATPKQKQLPSPLPNISDFTTEAIESIEPDGVEEVFDVQIEGTENFIANGVVSHNTRWHEDDLAGRILNSEDGPNWTVCSLPAEAEDNDPLGREVGEALCPERFDEQALAEIRGVMGIDYYALYQQRPVADEGGLYKRAWFTYEKPPQTVRGDLLFDYIIQAWDTASSKLGDWSACVTAGVADNKVYILDVLRERMETPDLKREVETQAERWGPRVILIEDASSGIAIQQMLRRETRLPIVAVPPHKGGKLSHARANAPYFEGGRVVFCPGAYLPALERELLAFPAGANDDQVDALNVLLSRVYAAVTAGRAGSHSGSARQ